MDELSFHDLHVGQVFDLGSVRLSEDEIIQFAKYYDPMPFHIDLEVAKKSHFKGLISSGPHLFHVFYNREWVPRFKNSVYAGKGIDKWNLYKPVYANTEISCTVEIKVHVPKPERGFGVVLWYFEFRNEQNELVQSLELTVMHKLVNLNV